MADEKVCPLEMAIWYSICRRKEIAEMMLSYQPRTPIPNRTLNLNEFLLFIVNSSLAKYGYAILILIDDDDSEVYSVPGYSVDYLVYYY